MSDSASTGPCTPQGVPYSDLRHFVNADGLHIFCRYWEPRGPPAGLVFIAHGAAEHCGPYDEMARRLAAVGLLAFSHDHAGHGQSQGSPRMGVADFQVFVRDVLHHVDLVKASYKPGLPLFMVGHSMGGAVAILAACQRPVGFFAGVALVAPMIRMNPESATPCKVFLARVLNRVLPGFPLGAVDPRWISRDPERAAEYGKDPLVARGGMRASFGVQLLNTAPRVEKELPDIAWPFLLLHGDVDKLCDIQGSRIMYERAASTDKTLRVYEGAYHSLHHELPEVKEAVLDEIASWIKERLTPKAQ